MSDSDILAIYGIATVFVVMVIVVYRRIRRRAELPQVAQAMGFSIDQHPEAVKATALVSLALFQRAGFVIGNVLRGGIDKTDVLLFFYGLDVNTEAIDDLLTLAGGPDTPYVVACFHVSEHSLPDFELIPEGLLDKVRTAFGYQDIDFNTDRTFSRHYLLRGADEPAIRALFHPGILRFLADRPWWSIESHHGWLAVYTPYKVRPRELPRFLDRATKVFSLLSITG